MYINYQDNRPVYEQIVDQYRELILYGIMEPGEQMPSVRSLAAELSINPNTIQKAFAELEHQGYIYSERGRGSFVRQSESLVESRIGEISDEMRALVTQAMKLGLDRQAIEKMFEKILNEEM